MVATKIFYLGHVHNLKRKNWRSSLRTTSCWSFWMIYQDTAHEVTSSGGRHFRYNCSYHYLSTAWVWRAGCLLHNHGWQLSTQSRSTHWLGIISLSWSSSSHTETRWQGFPSETACVCSCHAVLLFSQMSGEPGQRVCFKANVVVLGMWEVWGGGGSLYLAYFHAGMRKQQMKCKLVKKWNK